MEVQSHVKTLKAEVQHKIHNELLKSSKQLRRWFIVSQTSIYRQQQTLFLFYFILHSILLVLSRINHHVLWKTKHTFHPYVRVITTNCGTSLL